jgi:putative transport protein
MHSFVQALVEYPLLTVFIVIGLGYLVGQISFFGFKFGVAGVLFMGIAVGALDPAITIPEVIPSLGLIMFVYTIGIQTGPGFFNSFREKGARDNFFIFGMLILAMALTFAMGYAFHLPGARRAGLYAGALTNTPALAATRERMREQARQQNLSPDQARALADEPVVAYSIAYPIGVIGVLLSFALMRRLWGIKEFAPEETPVINARDYLVKNPGIEGRTLGDIMQLHRDPGFVISRVHQRGTTQLARPDIQLNHGDVVVVVGDEEGLERAEQIFGQPTEEHIELDRSEFDFRRVFVSSRDVVGKKISELELETKLAANITRLRRGDVDVVPTPDTRLEFGDRIRVLTRRSNFAAVSQFFGDSIKGTAETDFGSVSIGMVLGVLVGMLPIPLPGGQVLRLGLAGGPLLVALVLGMIERTGRVTWTIPISANLTLRQIGLLLFLSGVGTKAGYSFLTTMRGNGLQMLLAGAIVTITITILTLIIGYKLLKIPYDTVMGMMSGLQTQPAALAFSANMAKTDRPNLGYATVYPMAMIAKIILAQLLV